MVWNYETGKWKTIDIRFNRRNHSNLECRNRKAGTSNWVNYQALHPSLPLRYHRMANKLTVILQTLTIAGVPWYFDKTLRPGSPTASGGWVA